MCTWKIKTRLAWMVASAMFALLVGYPGLSFTQESKQKTFSSPGEASNALFQAVQNDDEQGVEGILGAGQELTSPSDNVEDKLDRARFALKYQQMHRLVREPDGSAILYVGAENWPFPIPLVSTNGAWRFDSRSGNDEVMFRRVGEDEEMAIGAFSLLVLAEKEYYQLPCGNGATHGYAMDFTGMAGSGGLYSKIDSAIPAKLAKAGAAGTVQQGGPAKPFYGYYFRILTAQGKNAPGGAENYISNGKMTGGFAFLAYPAEYKSSGVMTFIGGADGSVYEKDLGPATATIARSITKYNPDSTWHATE